jgi:hypothetical protein
MERPTAKQIVDQLLALPNMSTDERAVDDLESKITSQTLYNRTEHPFCVLSAAAQKPLVSCHPILTTPDLRPSTSSFNEEGHENPNDPETRHLEPETKLRSFEGAEDDGGIDSTHHHLLSCLEDLDVATRSGCDRTNSVDSLQPRGLVEVLVDTSVVATSDLLHASNADIPQGASMDNMEKASIYHIRHARYPAVDTEAIPPADAYDGSAQPLLFFAQQSHTLSSVPEFPSRAIKSSFSSTYTEDYDIGDISYTFFDIDHSPESESIPSNVSFVFVASVPEDRYDLVRHYLQNVVGAQASMRLYQTHNDVC